MKRSRYTRSGPTTPEIVNQPPKPSNRLSMLHETEGCLRLGIIDIASLHRHANATSLDSTINPMIRDRLKCHQAPRRDRRKTIILEGTLTALTRSKRCSASKTPEKEADRSIMGNAAAT